MTAAVCKLQAL